MVTAAMYLQTLSDGLLQRDARHFSDPIPVSESQAELANARWMNCPDIPLDMGGPVDRPFAPLGAGFADVPAIEHLNALARRFADRIAISDGVSEITYSDLLARVLTLANAISAATPKGQAVASLLRNSVWQPIAVLACMAAGTPLVPLNPRDPAQRLTDITAAARISVLIGQDGTHAAEWIENGGIRQIDVIRASEPAAAASPLPPIPVDAAARRALYLGQHRAAEGGCEQPAKLAPARPTLCGCMSHRCRRCLHASERPHDDCRLQRDVVRFVDGREVARSGCRGPRTPRPAASDPVAAGNNYLCRSYSAARGDSREPDTAISIRFELFGSAAKRCCGPISRSSER